MKELKLNKFKTDVPEKSAFEIPTDYDFPKLHTLCIASGKRGGGKSVAIANFIKTCKSKGYYDKVFLITPTYDSNKSIWGIASINEEDVFEPSVNVLKKIISIVEAEREEWDNFLFEKEEYEKFSRDISSQEFIPDDTLMRYSELGFLDDRKRPTWKYSQEVPPRLGVIIDDCLGTDLLAKPSAGLVNLCIKHRHIGKGLGISIFMLVQSYCAQGGLNRAIRENTTMLLLFKINQEAQIKKLYEESDLDMTEEQFIQMCKEVHSKEFNFLMMDFNPKENSMKFRSGWDTIIEPSLITNDTLNDIPLPNDTLNPIQKKLQE